MRYGLVIGTSVFLCLTGWTTPTTSRPGAPKQDAMEIAVSFSEGARKEPVTGRVLLLLSKTKTGDAREFDWFDMQPVYGILVTNLAAGERVTFSVKQFDDPRALAFPGPLRELTGTFYAQAIVDVDDSGGLFDHAPGNLYSDTVRVELKAGLAKRRALLADKVMAPEVTPPDTEWLKFVEVKSQLLSEFHGREVTMRAAVTVPAGYDAKSDRLYPVVYVIPGFGGRHFSATKFLAGEDGEKWRRGDWPYKALTVVLDPDVPLGHSVFANSANNGPVGDAVVKELIPEIERRFRAVAKPAGRIVRGHSSGGWSSLWLQVAYPEFFGGCWSTSPDPVDFRDFQTMNLYEDRNGHWSRDGQPRGLARDQHQLRIKFATFNHWEYVVGLGSQLDSFNAVFGPRGADGRPLPVMDKLSGAIDRTVAKAWKDYDIRLKLETNWAELGPKLKGKIHVLCGGWDTFYLNPAVERLRDFLSTTDYGGYVEIVPGDHGRLPEGFSERIRQEIGQRFRETGVGE